ncbi:hypothetical protein [Bdellovibrio sp. HCB2-146]|uniref:hypothetical protein n=1 Tax=Bdellovibrio sp. HCB2-146 TaxID=3394362 RepID=UPI0039BC5FBC
MTKVILAAVMSFSSLAMACPNLEGSFVYGGKTTIDIVQKQDEAGITTFEVTIDDHTCAVCKYDSVLRADGKTVRKDFPVSNSAEITTISCDENRLKFRRSREFYDETGRVVRTDDENFDYRINRNSDLVKEIIQDETPVYKSVHKRLN